MVRLVDYILNDVVGADGTLGINVIVNNLTDNTGIFRVTPANLTQLADYLNMSIPFEFAFPITEFTNLTIHFVGLNISGLNTWQALKFFVPVGENELNVRFST